MFLKSLSEAFGVSGQEDAVREVVLNAIGGLAGIDEITVDALGSITAVKRAAHPPDAGDTPRVLLAAHMDEIGFMVTGIDGEGLLRFTAVGGVDERILPGLRVRVGEKALPGVIIWTPIHLNTSDDAVKISTLRIDIGANSKDDANGKVKRGDRITFDTPFREVTDRLVRGKALDDRAGCSLLIDVLRDERPLAVDVYAAFTVQEEIGLRGAQVVAQSVQPHFALALEATTANDVPDLNADPDDEREANPVCRMGGGPVLSPMDARTLTPPRVLAYLIERAQAAGIPFQFKTMPGGGTDAGAIHIANAGVPAASISLPCRYIHSPLAYLHRDDYDAALRLTLDVLYGLDAERIRALRHPN